MKTILTTVLFCLITMSAFSQRKLASEVEKNIYTLEVKYFQGEDAIAVKTNYSFAKVVSVDIKDKDGNVVVSKEVEVKPGASFMLPLKGVKPSEFYEVDLKDEASKLHGKFIRK